MIYFRADANKSIATGHIMRCLSIADAFKKLKEPSTFISSDEYSVDIIKNRGYEVYILHSNWEDKESELPDLKHYLSMVKAKLLIVDSYQVTEKYMNELQKAVKLAYIDDLGLLSLSADLVINYSPCFKEAGYYQKLDDREMDEKGRKYLLGYQYVPLRQEFSGIEHTVKVPVTDVMITTGGSDPLNVIGKLMESLITSYGVRKSNGDEVDISHLKTITYHLILGKYNEFAEEIKCLYHTIPNVRIYENVKNMEMIMKKCDAAISAGGTTVKELCACGVPVIAFAFADNQVKALESEEKEGIIISVGDIRGNVKKSIVDMVINLAELTCDYNRLVSTSERMQALVDGNGALRIAEQCLKLIRSN